MMSTNKEKIISFLNEQIAQADFRTKAYVFDEKDQRRPQRDIFTKIKSYLDKFLEGNTNNRWITLTGLRGAGKTTVLSQIFNSHKGKEVYRLLLYLDQTSQLLGASLDEIIYIYEELIGKSLEKLDKPLLLFLDEVQYDKKWAVTLKSIFDRSNKVFIFTTGSAALLMNTNPDIARRAIFEKLFPLSFAEYLKIKQQKNEIKGLEKKIREAIFLSKNAKEVFSNLKNLEKKANEYYLGISRFEFEKYLNYGSLPFMIASENEAIVYDQIHKTLDRVISEDISGTGRFSSATVSKISAILYSVADMDTFSFSKISEKFNIKDRSIVSEIFNLLEQTEVLHRIYPHGSHLNQASNKASKYLFSSPAFRAMYYKMIGNTISPENYKGKLWEDLISMYLHRILYKNPGKSLIYDSAQGGADFILGIGAKKIVIEVGAGKKGYRQIISTSKKIKADYGIIISNDSLDYSEEFNAVKIPLRLFLLA